MSDATCAICATGLPVPVICTGCAAKVRRDLDTVGRLRAQLDPTPGRTGSAGRASGKPGSKPPANLTIIAMADIRSHFRLTDDGEADPDNVTNVDADLLTEARWVIEERRLNPPMRDVFDSLRILNIHLDWITEHPRIDEFAAVITGCAHALRTVLHDWPETSVGRCTAAHPERDACGGPLRLAYDGQLPEDPAPRLPLESDDLAANLHALERLLLHRALRRAYGNRLEAAKRMGVSRRHLYLLIARHGDPVRGQAPTAEGPKRLRRSQDSRNPAPHR